MQQYSIHEATAPSISLTKVTLDGTHNGAFQTGLGNWRIYGWGTGSPILWTGHIAQMPSGSFSQTSLDGTHNGAFQSGVGWRDLSLYSHDTSFIQTVLATTLSLGGFIFSKFHGIYQLFVVSVLSFAGVIQRSLSRRLTANLPLTGLFRRGRIFLGNLSFAAAHAVKHVYNRILPALLSFSPLLSSHWRNLYSLYLTSSLAFPGLVQRTNSRFFSSSARFNQIPGAFTKLTSRFLPAISSFVGAMNTFRAHFYLKLMTATQSFSAAFSPIYIHNLILTATLFFIGSIQTFKGHFFFRAFPAALPFVGLVSRFPLKGFGSTASFNASLPKTTIKNTFTAAVHFFTSWLGHIPGLFLQAFSSTLSFATNFIVHTVGTTFLSLGSVLNFTTRINTRRIFFMYASLAFVGFLDSLYLHFQLVLRSVLSFIGDWSQKRRNIGFQAYLSFHGQERSHWFIPFQKAWAATLRFSGFLSAPGVHNIILKSLSARLSLTGRIFTMPAQILLEATLRFRGTLNHAWNKMRSLFLVVAQALGQEIVFSGTHEAKAGQVVSNTQVIGITPQMIDFGGLPDGQLNTLFIKNTDAIHTVKIAADNSFTMFTQSIPPQLGVYLSPLTTTIWAVAIGAPVSIEVIAGT